MLQIIPLSSFTLHIFCMNHQNDSIVTNNTKYYQIAMAKIIATTNPNIFIKAKTFGFAQFSYLSQWWKWDSQSRALLIDNGREASQRRPHCIETKEKVSLCLFVCYYLARNWMKRLLRKKLYSRFQLHLSNLSIN